MFNIGDKVVAKDDRLEDLDYLKQYGINDIELLKNEILIIRRMYSFDIVFDDKIYAYPSKDFITFKEHQKETRKQKLKKINLHQHEK